MITVLAVIYIVFISLGLPDSVFGVTWPVMHLELGVAESFGSMYGIITGIGSGCVSFFAGKLIRRFGTPRVSFFSIILTALGLVGMSLSPNIWVMFIFTVILSLGAGAIDTGLNNYVSLHYEAKHMSWLHCFWGVGVTMSPLIMSIFLGGETGAWRVGYRTLAAIQLFIALIVLFSLKKWVKLDKEKSSVQQSEVEQTKKAEKPHFFKIRGLVPSIVSLGCYCSMEFLIGTWVASYLVNAYCVAPDAAAKWVSFYYGGVMLGRLVSGFLTAKLADRLLIRYGACLSVVGMVMLLLPLGNASFFGLLLIGFGFGPVFPSVIHSVPERFGKEFSADITGFHMGGAYAVGFAVQLAFGYIATETTFKITPFVLLAFAAAMITLNEIACKKTLGVK